MVYNAGPMRRLLPLLLALACATPQPPAPQPAEVPGQEQAIGTVKVTATTLNVRREPSASADVIAQVRKGERLALLSSADEWDRIRLGTGALGFVSAPPFHSSRDTPLPSTRAILTPIFRLVSLACGRAVLSAGWRPSRRR